MTLKIIDATEAKPGVTIMVDGQAFTVKKMDVSKTGKHGHAKCRIEAVNVMNENKKVFVVPGHERFDVPMINKRKGQVLSVGEKVSLMDLESFETVEVVCSDELKSQIGENANVEYWEINGELIIKRVQ